MSCVGNVTCFKTADFTGADCQLELPSEDLYEYLFVLCVVSVVLSVIVVVWDYFFHQGMISRDYDRYEEGVFPLVSPFFSIIFSILFIVQAYMDLKIRSDFDACDEYSGISLSTLDLSVMSLIVNAVAVVGSCWYYEQPEVLLSTFSNAGCAACCNACV